MSEAWSKYWKKGGLLARGFAATDASPMLVRAGSNARQCTGEYIYTVYILML